MLFNTGDRYIRFTKYSSIIIGQVQEYGVIHHMDLNNGVCYEIPTIKTTKGYVLNLDGSDGQIFKVTKEYSQEEIERLREFYKLSKQEKVRYIINKKMLR